MTKFIYDGTTDGLRKAFELSKQGVRILCPKCGAELVVAPDLESANKHRIHPGIYCPRSPTHVHELLEIRPQGSLPEMLRKVQVTGQNGSLWTADQGSIKE